jgi:uncharacterized membrane protein
MASGSYPDHDVRLARLREWLGTGLWFLPMLWAVGAITAALVLVGIDHRLGGDDPKWLVFGSGADNARTILSVIAASAMAFTGTVFSILIVALQLASTQFSPRVLRTFLRDRGSQHCLGVFVATSVYAIVVLRDVGDEVEVPGLALTGAFCMVILSIFAFVFLIHHVASSIRAVSIIETVAAETRRSIRENFPPEGAPDEPAPDERALGEPDQVVTLDRGPGNLHGHDEDDLVRIGTEHDCTIVVLPTIGDYLPSNIPVFHIHGADGVDPERLLRHIGTGRERTTFQDTAFGFRQLVDVAVKALSPGINDPTTAVQCIDRIHDLLRRIAVRPTPTGHHHDDAGVLRLVVPRPGWDDYVHLAFDEIRHSGVGQVQIPRRMRAALLDLKTVAGPERQVALDLHLTALDDAVGRTYDNAEDRARADEADLQGLR